MKIKNALILSAVSSLLSTALFSEDFNKARHNGKVGLRHGLNGVEAQGTDPERRVINEGEIKVEYDYTSKNLDLLKSGDVAIYANIKTGAKLLIPIYASYGAKTDDNCDCNLPNIGFDGINADVVAKMGNISNGPVFTMRNNLKLFGRDWRFFSEDRDGVGSSTSFSDRLLFGGDSSTQEQTTAELRHLLANPHQLVKSSSSSDTLTGSVFMNLGDFIFEGYLKGGIELASFNMIMPDSDFWIGSYGAGVVLMGKGKHARKSLQLDFERSANMNNTDKLQMSDQKLELGLDLGTTRLFVNNQQTLLDLPSEQLAQPHRINAFNFGIELEF